MKRVLLATTALVAAGLLVTSVAYADEHEMAEEEMMEQPVTVGIAGYTMGAIGFASDSDDDTRGHGIKHVYEFAVSGSSTLDNGITASVYAQLGSSGDPFDEQHITLSGEFGSLRLGRTESAAYNATVGAPGAGIIFGFGVNYNWFYFGTQGVNTYSGISAEDAQKVVYTSPNFNGLTIGMSYAPEADDSTTFGTPGRATNDDGQVSEHAAFGLTYTTEFMGSGSVTVGAAYETGVNESGGEDPVAMKAGINVAIDEISFGGGMYDQEDTVDADGVDTSGMQFDVGASWTQGPLNVGIQYAVNDSGTVSAAVAGEGHTHGAGGVVVDNPGTPAVYGETTMAALHVNYTLGPGVTIGAQVAASTFEGGDDVTQVLLGTSIFF